MKKMYSKPEIVFENFAISTNIAAGCYYKTKNPAENTCGYDDGRNGRIFTSDVGGTNGCTYTQPDNNESLCYHVPNEDYDIFNS